MANRIPLLDSGHVVLPSCELTPPDFTCGAGRGYPGSCHCSQVDLSDAASVRTFAAEVQRDARARGGLQLLVNNAGVMGCARDGPRPEDDGHLWPNHLGPFLLTHLLLPSLKPGARVVNVASRAHHQARRARPYPAAYQCPLLGGCHQPRPGLPGKPDTATRQPNPPHTLVDPPVYPDAKRGN